MDTKKTPGDGTSRQTSYEQGTAGNNIEGSPGQGTLERRCAWPYFIYAPG